MAAGKADDISKKYQIVETLPKENPSHTTTKVVMRKKGGKGKGNKFVLRESNLERYYGRKPKEFESVFAEFNALKSVNHLYLANFIGISSQPPSTIFFEREYLDGYSLDDAVQRLEEPFHENHVLEWLGQLILALKYLHNKVNMIHRNIKASNVFIIIDSDGTSAAKLTDMITHKLFEETRYLLVNHATISAETARSLGHYAPELVKPKPKGVDSGKHVKPSYDSQIDMWALGVVLYQMMTLEHPFLDDSWENMSASIKNGEYRRMKEEKADLYQQKLHDIVKRLLARNKSHRPSANQLANEISEKQLVEAAFVAAQSGKADKIQEIASLIENDKNVLCAKEDLLASLESERSRFDVDIEDGQNVNDTALHVAARYGAAKVAQVLVKGGVPPDITNNVLDTPLHCCKSEEVAKVLIDNKANVNARGQLGRTALHFAVERNNMPIARLLLDTKGVDIEAKEDQMGATPLHLAAWLGSVEMIALLVEAGARIQARDKDGDSPLHTAVFENQIEVVKYLVNSLEANPEVRNTSTGRTPLHTAVENMRTEIVDFFIMCKVNLDIRDKETGSSPLHLACQFGHDTLVRKLLTAGAKVDIPDMMGDLAIHRAATYGHVQAMGELLDFKAHPDAVDAVGRTALMLASHDGFVDIVDNLMRFWAAHYEARESSIGYMAIHFAAANGQTEVVKMLLNKDLTLCNRDCSVRGKGRTPFHLAVINGHVETVEAIIAVCGKILDSTQKDSNGNTARNLMRTELADNDEIDSSTKEEMERLFTENQLS